MSERPTAEAAGQIDVGGDLTVNRLGFGAMRITGKGIWGGPPDRDQAKAAVRFLGQPMGKALHAKLQGHYDEWSAKKDDKELVEAVFTLSEQFGKEKRVQTAPQRLTAEDLELICYEYISS